MNQSNKIFNGEGFKDSPLEGPEAAQHRHMYHEVAAAWPNLKQANLVLKAGKILIGAGLAIGATLQYLGWLG